MSLRIVPATAEHLAALAANIRDPDRAEVLAMGYESPLEGLRESFHASLWTKTALVPEGVLCVFGLVPSALLGGQACPWMLSSHLLSRRPRLLLRESRREVAAMLRSWPLLQGYVDARYQGAVRWLSWLGFALDPPRSVNGVPFHLFTLRPEENRHGTVGNSAASRRGRHERGVGAVRSQSEAPTAALPGAACRAQRRHRPPERQGR